MVKEELFVSPGKNEFPAITAHHAVTFAREREGEFHLSTIQTADGAMLSAGTYYVAFGGFNTTFTNGFGASSTFFDFDDAPMTLTVYSGVPTPASASLLALGGLACARRRRA